MTEAEALPVLVPGCWEMVPGFETHRGKGIYRREIHCGGHVRLVFKGVGHTADVRFDGVHAGHHYNAYTPFDVILPEVTPGLHVVEVTAENDFTPESALHIPNDYHSYGGICRPVAVELLPDAYIRSVHLTPVLEDGVWRLDAEVTVSNIGAQARRVAVTLSLRSSEEAVHPHDSEPIVRTTLPESTVEAGKTFKLRASVSCPGVRGWSLEQPALYLVEAILSSDARPGSDSVPILDVISMKDHGSRTDNGSTSTHALADEYELKPSDDLIERVGFREVRISGRQILLNGEPLRIKGFCRHEDHPMYGCALSPAAMDQDLNLLRDLGANAVRTSHYPNDEIFLDLCDERGVLVWEENHARGLTEEHMRNPYFREQCRVCIDEMIEAHFNHPSIIIWGILNECASETEYGRDCYAEQFRQIKALDPSRPTSFASCKFFNDLSLGLPDIVSYNIYPRWYHDTPVQDYLDSVFNWIQADTEGAGKPFIISEIGAAALYGCRSPRRAKWTEERQSDILDEQLGAVLAKDGCSGVFIWQFCDVRVSEEWSATRARTMNNKGVVDEYRRPKLSYETVKRQFAKA